MTKPLQLLVVVLLVVIGNHCHAYIITPTAHVTSTTTNTQLNGLFDRFVGGGSASKSDLDDQWEAQQEILRARRQPKTERDKYFRMVEERRAEASAKQQANWAWQTKQYAKGEDPINEWKKRRESGVISDLDNQYGDPKKIGGIPLPMASFGVGGEFGGTKEKQCIAVPTWLSSISLSLLYFIVSWWKIRQWRTIRFAIALC
jgi:hypothetical protein